MLKPKKLMKLDAVGVTTTNMKKTIEFYSLLGFDFAAGAEREDHAEPYTKHGSARLMIDTVDIVEDIIGETPKPSNHSCFAIRLDTVAEVDEISARVDAAGFKVFKEPWDTFWGQRYAVVEDPDGYKVDLYAYLK